MPTDKAHRYKTLLRVRRLLEEGAAGQFAAVAREKQVAEQRRAELSEQRRALLADTGAQPEYGLDSRDMRMRYAYERHLVRLGMDQDAYIAQIAGRLEAKRVELEEAVKERRMMERLEERAMDAVRVAERKAEQKAHDEIAVMRQARYMER